MSVFFVIVTVTVCLSVCLIDRSIDSTRFERAVALRRSREEGTEASVRVVRWLVRRAVTTRLLRGDYARSVGVSTTREAENVDSSVGETPGGVADDLCVVVNGRGR